MKRSLLVSTALHLVFLAGVVFWASRGGPSARPTMAVHLGVPRAVEAPVAASSTPTQVNTLASLPPAPRVLGPSSGSPSSISPPSPAIPTSGSEASTSGLPGDNLAVDTLTPGAVVEKPSLVSYPTPTYPREARRNAWEGVVEVEITVSETGKGADLKVIKSSGHEALDLAALEALRQAKYEPAVHNGVAEAGVLDAVVRFRLN